MRSDANDRIPDADEIKRLKEMRSRFELKSENLRDLYLIQEAIELEVGEVVNIDQVLRKVLSFYNGFVNFRPRAIDG